MSCRTLLSLFFLVLIIASAEGLCNWDVDISPPPGMAECTGSLRGGVGEPWPRLPTDAEIDTAKEDYLAYLIEGEDERRIDGVTVEKFHTCEGGSWVNHVDMKVDWSWWWSSTTGEGEWKQEVSETFLVFTPGNDAFEFVVTRVPSPYFLGWYNDAVQGFATGTCSSGGTSGSSGGGTSPDTEEGPPWVVIIGAIAVLGAAGIAGAKLLGGKKKTAATGGKPDKEKKKEKEKIRYILQLSADHLTVTADSPASLTVTAWKIIDNNPPAPAPEAALTLSVSSGDQGLSVQPSSGQGTMESSITLVSPVSQNPVMITVTASAGKGSISSQVTVDIPADYVMEFF